MSNRLKYLTLLAALLAAFLLARPSLAQGDATTSRWTNLFSAADSSTATGVALAPQTALTIVGQRPGWYQVTSESGNGWVPLSAVDRAKPGAQIVAWTDVYDAIGGSRSGKALQPNTPVEIVAQSDNGAWVHVRAGDVDGWVPQNKIKTLSSLPYLAELKNGWNEIAPGGDTSCSLGTDFSFYVRPGDPEKLLVYLQGGGACWFGAICDVTGTPTFDPLVDETDDPRRASGIFAFGNAENPFADYTMVYVPYCTADVHIGDRVGSYEVEGKDEPVLINHNGYNNVSSALGWMFDNYQGPQTVFVTGSSAGSIPSPFYAAIVANQYDDARIVQLGDAAGGYRNPDAAVQLLTAWNTPKVLAHGDGYDGIPTADTTFETLYVVTGQQHPDMTLAQYNTAHDSTQLFFLSLLGIVGVPLPELLEANFADIRAEIPNFYTYTAGGEVHTILGRPEFYSYTVDGVRFVDWVADLAQGAPVSNVSCDVCDEAEITQP